MRKTYRSEWVKCGKGCSGCPHGPYWYAYWKVKGKLHKEYIGKELPHFKEEKRAADAPAADWRDEIIHERTASATVAYRILGVPHGSDRVTTQAAYRKLAKENHPDRGGDGKVSCYINAAWTYLKKVKNWS